MEEGQKCWNLLSKKTTKGKCHKIGKMGRRCLWMAPYEKNYLYLCIIICLFRQREAHFCEPKSHGINLFESLGQ